MPRSFEYLGQVWDIAQETHANNWASFDAELKMRLTTTQLYSLTSVAWRSFFEEKGLEGMDLTNMMELVFDAAQARYDQWKVKYDLRALKESAPKFPATTSSVASSSTGARSGKSRAPPQPPAVTRRVVLKLPPAPIAQSSANGGGSDRLGAWLTSAKGSGGVHVLSAAGERWELYLGSSEVIPFQVPMDIVLEAQACSRLAQQRGRVQEVMKEVFKEFAYGPNRPFGSCSSCAKREDGESACEPHQGTAVTCASCTSSRKGCSIADRYSAARLARLKGYTPQAAYALMEGIRVGDLCKGYQPEVNEWARFLRHLIPRPASALGTVRFSKTSVEILGGKPIVKKVKKARGGRSRSVKAKSVAEEEVSSVGEGSPERDDVVMGEGSAVQESLEELESGSVVLEKGVQDVVDDVESVHSAALDVRGHDSGGQEGSDMEIDSQEGDSGVPGGFDDVNFGGDSFAEDVNMADFDAPQSPLFEGSGSPAHPIQRRSRSKSPVGTSSQLPLDVRDKMFLEDEVMRKSLEGCFSEVRSLEGRLTRGSEELLALKEQLNQRIEQATKMETTLAEKISATSKIQERFLVEVAVASGSPIFEGPLKHLSESARVQMDVLETQLKEAQQQISSLKSEKERLEEDRRRDRQDLDWWEVEGGILRSEWDNWEEEAYRLRDDFHSAADENDRLRENLDRFFGEFQDSYDRGVRLQEENVQLSNRISELESRGGSQAVDADSGSLGGGGERFGEALELEMQLHIVQDEKEVILAERNEVTGQRNELLAERDRLEDLVATLTREREEALASLVALRSSNRDFHQAMSLGLSALANFPPETSTSRGFRLNTLRTSLVMALGKFGEDLLQESLGL